MRWHGGTDGCDSSCFFFLFFFSFYFFFFFFFGAVKEGDLGNANAKLCEASLNNSPFTDPEYVKIRHHKSSDPVGLPSFVRFLVTTDYPTSLFEDFVKFDDSSKVLVFLLVRTLHRQVAKQIFMGDSN